MTTTTLKNYTEDFSLEQHRKSFFADNESSIISDYKKASIQERSEIRILLGDAFDITKIVKTFEDACDILYIKKKDLKEFIPFKNPKNDFQQSQNAFAKLQIIIKSINEGWKPNWDNREEYKYYPYFNMAGGFAFVGTASNYDYTDSDVGSQLCFKTKNDAEFAGKQFEYLYKIFMTYQN